MDVSVAELVGKRALLKVSRGNDYAPGFYYLGVQEYTVLEIAPSGNWVKLLSMCGDKFWLEVSDVEIVEVLGDRCIREQPAGLASIL